jgi:hypothetical protein
MGPVEQAGHLAKSAARSVEQSAAVAGTTEQAAVTGRAAEHADVVVLVAAIGHVKQAKAMTVYSLICHIDLSMVPAVGPVCQD